MRILAAARCRLRPAATLALWLSALALLGGCAGLPNAGHGPASVALPADASSALARLAEQASPDPELSGFRLMPGGAFALDARLELIRLAERSLDVQYYQIENDETGRYLLRQLRDAASRGVRVRLLIDDLYTAGDEELLLGLALHSNVELRLFNPFTAGRAHLATRLLGALFEFERVNRRMHNKLMVADGAMAVAGGRNIANRYFRRTIGENFIDLDTFVAGAAVPKLAQLFDQYWNSPYVFPIQSIVASRHSGAALRQRFDQLTAPDRAPPPEPPPPNDVLGYGPIRDDLAAGRLGLIWTTAEVYADSPDRVIGRTVSYGGVPLLDVEAVRYNVVEQMRRAQSEIAIASPYFIPGEVGLEVLSGIRRKGVSVSVVTSSLAATDEPLVHTGYRRYREDMLRLGIDLYELSSNRARRSLRLGVFNTSIGRLHLKTAVIDRRVLFIGSMNFDPRSKYHNTEIGLIVSSPQMAQQVLKLVDLLKQQGSYRLRIGAISGAIEWVSEEADGVSVLDSEPDTDFWTRLLLQLLAPLTPESLL
jgi:putative cardiolipin synthase